MAHKAWPAGPFGFDSFAEMVADSLANKESALTKETRLGHDLSSHPGGTGELASHLQGGGKVGDDHR